MVVNPHEEETESKRDPYTPSSAASAVVWIRFWRCSTFYALVSPQEPGKKGRERTFSTRRPRKKIERSSGSATGGIIWGRRSLRVGCECSLGPVGRLALTIQLLLWFLGIGIREWNCLTRHVGLREGSSRFRYPTCLNNK